MYSVRVTISLFTRAMISSTTVSAGERDGSNSAQPTANSRGSPVFFIRALSKPGVNPGKFVSLFYAASSMKAKRGGQAKNSRRDSRCLCGDGPLARLTGRSPITTRSLISARQRKRGHVVVLGSHVHEVLNASQDALGKVFGRSRSRLQDALDPVQTKFDLLRFGLHHSA